MNESLRMRSKNKANTNANASTITIPTSVQEQYPDLHILYQDENYMCISKPSSMLCYASSTSKKANTKSVEDLFLNHHLSTLNSDALGIVHRLDRGTSGCLLLAKNESAHAKLTTAFFQREVQKTYLALVPATASVSHVNDEVGVDTCQGATGTIHLPVDGRPALSSYSVEQIHHSVSEKKNHNNISKNIAPHQQQAAALTIRVETRTGRKHQVRVHCAYGLHRPLFLDPTYSSETTTTTSLIPHSIQAAGQEDPHRFFLHAATLHVPCLGIIQCEAPLPKWWTQALEKL